MSLPAVVSTETFGVNFTICLKSLVAKSESFSPDTTSIEIGTSCSFSARFWAVTTTSPSVGCVSAAMAEPADRLTSIVVESSIRAIIAVSPLDRYQRSVGRTLLAESALAREECQFS